jgi:uncharacterized protein YjbI with pentapeptide repeats
VDFGAADLSSANFAGSDLSAALFEQTNLQKADFRSAYNFLIDPDINHMKKARFTKDGLAGLLTKYDLIIE